MGIIQTLVKLSPQNYFLILALITFPYLRRNFGYIIGIMALKFSEKASMVRKSRRPKRIILVRHGESIANLFPNCYNYIPDNKITLSDKGLTQATELGQKLKELIKDESVKFYVSPFKRTRDTYLNVIEFFKSNRTVYQEDPRVREQEWGNYQNIEKQKKIIMKERNHCGRFYYRFESGESGADVYDRSSAFLESLYREMDMHGRERFDNYVIITHGLFMRLFLMRFYKWEVNYFEKVLNPRNCEIWILNKNNQGKFELGTDIRVEK